MTHPIKVIDLELTAPLTDVTGLDGYQGLLAIVRLRGAPIAYLRAPVTLGRCSAATLGRRLVETIRPDLARALARAGLLEEAPATDRFDLARLLAPWVHSDGFSDQLGVLAPKVTVAVCTRDRPEDLRLCLAALSRLDYDDLELLVVDNAPATQETAALVREHFPAVRYVCEPRPGLDWARNRAILEAQGEILAYTDDDVVVDPGWVKAIARGFLEHPDVMAITGLVVPFELETEAQVLFEEYGGFGRGFRARWWRVPRGQPLPWQLLGLGQFGTGANMAYRRSLFDQVGMFDPALDVGTLTRGGGDLEMFFRVLATGHTLMYEPRALVRHRHRRTLEQLKTQIASNGALFAVWTAIFRHDPRQRRACLRIGAYWMATWNLRRWLRSWIYPRRFPRALVSAELLGGIRGTTSYPRSRRQAREIARRSGPQGPAWSAPGPQESAQASDAVAVRDIDLGQPLVPLEGLRQYRAVRLFVRTCGRLLGHVEIPVQGAGVSRLQQAEAIADRLAEPLLALPERLDPRLRETLMTAALAGYFGYPASGVEPQLPDSIAVSIAVATYDRPDDLRNCLESLIALETRRPVQIIVVDNHPLSGLTAPVVADFPEVERVEEPRQGSAYARNAGILAATGEILVTTDDDVTVPPAWLERLIAPFARADVMAVTGHILPLALEQRTQQQFERYGGLGRGYERFEVDGRFFEASARRVVRTWDLGGTANSAYRCSLFDNTAIGLMEETLGAGMPSGVGEDTYLFYRILKAGHALCYEPDAYVWHRHRCDDAALRSQLYNYSKGHVAYHLTTLLKDGDLRALKYLLWNLPVAQLKRLARAMLGRGQYPGALMRLEIRGNLAGPWALWQSYRRVRREGRSR
ncbi:glycosyltransferase [Thiorhodococcus minor]|uniref:Glycosyltransferase n=1 Tax=Thiorhodococcus minor TaxID=57489 RepID=A0A6M0JXD6_9GAMM|nr:glycosyltransferase [Thiorhodococcus minor]NEV62206.1 glycosyltransferase [Thiorhodococcus minor]